MSQIIQPPRSNGSAPARPAPPAQTSRLRGSTTASDAQQAADRGSGIYSRSNAGVTEESGRWPRADRLRVAASIPTTAPLSRLKRWWGRWGGAIFIAIGFATATYLTATWINNHALITTADARVGMLEETGMPSHFTADNHGGAVAIVWWPGGDFLKERVITGPNLGELGSDVQPRLSFGDVDGDGHVDLVLMMNRNCYFFTSNGKDGFNPMQTCVLTGGK